MVLRLTTGWTVLGSNHNEEKKFFPYTFEIGCGVHIAYAMDAGALPQGYRGLGVALTTHPPSSAWIKMSRATGLDLLLSVPSRHVTGPSLLLPLLLLLLLLLLLRLLLALPLALLFLPLLRIQYNPDSHLAHKTVTLKNMSAVFLSPSRQMTIWHLKKMPRPLPATSSPIHLSLIIQLHTAAT